MGISQFEDDATRSSVGNHRQVQQLIEKVSVALERFCRWLDAFGEVSWDHQSFYAGSIGGRAKVLYYRWPTLGVIAVLPMVACEAALPGARRMFHRAQRFPIADAHYAMGFALLSHLAQREECYTRAVHFLDVLEAARCEVVHGYGWGYPFDWVTRTGVMRAGTPLITTTPYVYEAFAAVHAIDAKDRWLAAMRATAEHVFHDYPDRSIAEDEAAVGYNPHDTAGCVVNASAYRAFLLTEAAKRFAREDFSETAKRNLNFVLRSQQPDGSWFYAMDGVRHFIDHFHTCFVLKALAKIEKLTGDPSCTRAIEAGINYYVNNLFDANLLPRSFARAPRLTVYRQELYDHAECINLGSLLLGRFPQLDTKVDATLVDLLRHWQKPDGSLRARRLVLGWDNVPMHRWAQSQAFRALAAYWAASTGHA